VSSGGVLVAFWGRAWRALGAPSRARGFPTRRLVGCHVRPGGAGARAVLAARCDARPHCDSRTVFSFVEFTAPPL
jgi:hypothetical protein